MEKGKSYIRETFTSKEVDIIALISAILREEPTTRHQDSLYWGNTIVELNLDPKELGYNCVEKKSDRIFFEI